MAALTTIVFDFDGTLVRTREASWALFQETSARFGLGVDSPEAFYRMFDGNFYVALDEVAGGSGTRRAQEVRDHFLGLLRTRYQPDLVPGMAAVVHDLADTYSLVVLSSNTMETLRRILLENELAQCFAHVLSGDIAPDKHAALRRLLDDPGISCGRRCSPHYDEGTPTRRAAAAEVMLVTDTVGDVEAGLQAGVRVGAVAWGMHSADALEAARAEFVCIWPEELVAYLRPGEPCAVGRCRLPSPSSHPMPSSTPRPPADSVAQAAGARRSRRAESADRLATRLAHPPAPAPPEPRPHPGPSTGGDPVLRRVLFALAATGAVQGEGE